MPMRWNQRGGAVRRIRSLERWRFPNDFAADAYHTRIAPEDCHETPRERKERIAKCGPVRRYTEPR